MLWRYGTGKPVSLSKTETQIPFGNDNKGNDNKGSDNKKWRLL